MRQGKVLNQAEEMQGRWRAYGGETLLKDKTCGTFSFLLGVLYLLL